MAEARQQLATLRPEIRDALEPLLAPPVCADRSLWDSLDTTNGAVRIWWRKSSPADAAHAARMRVWIDSDIWTKLVALYGGRQPLSDIAESCNGGDGKLDIYHSDRGKPLVTPFRGCGPAPLYVTSNNAKGGINYIVHCPPNQPRPVPLTGSVCRSP